jgi:hypothetical protein
VVGSDPPVGAAVLVHLVSGVDPVREQLVHGAVGVTAGDLGPAALLGALL